MIELEGQEKLEKSSIDRDVENYRRDAAERREKSSIALETRERTLDLKAQRSTAHLAAAAGVVLLVEAWELARRRLEMPRKVLEPRDAPPVAVPRDRRHPLVEGLVHQPLAVGDRADALWHGAAEDGARAICHTSEAARVTAP